MTDTHDNAQFKTTGTIRATAVIRAGEEILMAYGADYWPGQSPGDTAKVMYHDTAAIQQTI